MKICSADICEVESCENHAKFLTFSALPNFVRAGPQKVILWLVVSDSVPVHLYH